MGTNSAVTVVPQLAKKLLVSLYGKFIQRITSWEDCDSCWILARNDSWAVYSDEQDTTEQFRHLWGKVQHLKSKVQGEDTFPAISSCITAAGRHYMTRLREIAGKNNVYMQYTDSLLVNKEGFKRLNTAGFVGDTTIGQLRYQGSYDDAIIYGPNDCTLNGQLYISGIPKDAVQIGQHTYRFTRQHYAVSHADEAIKRQLLSSIVEIDLKRTKPHEITGESGWLNTPVYPITTCQEKSK
jgi:hypothetical protein